MAGNGKGALRIAIEDFFETTRIGKWISSWFGILAEDHERAMIREIEQLLREVATIPELKPYFDPEKLTSSTSSHQGAVLMIVGAILGLGFNVMSSIIAPIAQKAEYLSNRKNLPYRFDPETIAHGMIKKPEQMSKFISDAFDLGVSEDRLVALMGLAEELLPAQEYVHAWLRGLLSEQDLQAKLVKLGYSVPTIDTIKSLAKVVPGIQDLISMAVREAWNEETSRRFEYDAELPSEAASWAAKQGLDIEWFKRYWRAHWTLPSPTQAYEMLHRLRPGVTNFPFTTEDMRLLLKTADYPAFWRDRLIAISYAPYTRVDIRRMYGMGILTKDQVYQAYLDLGYDEEHAKNLADFAIRYEDDQGQSKREKYNDLTISLIREAYTKKIVDRETAMNYLRNLRYSDEEIDVILRLAEFQKVISSRPDYIDQYKAALKTSIEKAYSARMLSASDASTMLSTIGLHPDEIKYSLTNSDFIYNESLLSDRLKLLGDCYISRIMDQTSVITELGQLNVTGAEQTQLLEEWEVQRTYRTRRLSEAQYRTAWKRGIITEDGYRDAMAGLGYTDADIEILVQISGLSEVT